MLRSRLLQPFGIMRSYTTLSLSFLTLNHPSLSPPQHAHACPALLNSRSEHSPPSTARACASSASTHAGLHTQAQRYATLVVRTTTSESLTDRATRASGALGARRSGTRTSVRSTRTRRVRCTLEHVSCGRSGSVYVCMNAGLSLSTHYAVNDFTNQAASSSKAPSETTSGT